MRVGPLAVFLIDSVRRRELLSAGLAALVVCGCVTVPERYKSPQRIYEPRIERLSVVGFHRKEFVETGRSAGALVSPNLGLYGVTTGTSGKYLDTSDASAFRWLLEETRCVRVTDESPGGALRVEGRAGAESRRGFLFTLIGVLEVFTLTPLIGVPVPDGADGWATARLYREGEFVKAYRANTRREYATTLYTLDSDATKGRAVTRAMALRELADQVTADLCD